MSRKPRGKKSCTIACTLVDSEGETRAMSYNSGQELFSEPEDDSLESPIVMRTSGSSDKEDEETRRSCEPGMALLFQLLKQKQQPTILW